MTAPIVALSVPPGRAMGELDGDEISDAALDDVWRQVGLLHEARIAHRSLSRDHLVVDGDTVTVAGLDSAVLASSADSRAVDRAELLVTSALLVGADRALDAAIRSVDVHDLAATLPFVQLPALPAHVRRDAKKPKHFVDDLRTGLQVRLDVDAVELAELERISVTKAVSWVGFAVLAFFLLTLVSNWSEIVDTMSGLDWVWVVPIVIVTLLGTVGGAMSLSGSVVRPIALGEATIVMFGQSFLNRFTPMNAGGMAMRIRYLQKGGTDGTVATAAIGLTSLASGVIQVVFFVFFVVVASADPTGGLDLTGSGPDFSIVAVFAIAILIAAVVIAAAPKFRRWFVGISHVDAHQDQGGLRRTRPSPVEALPAVRRPGVREALDDPGVRVVVSSVRRRPRLRRTRRAVHGGQHRGLCRADTGWRRSDRSGAGVHVDRRSRRRRHRLGSGAALPPDQLLVPDDPGILRAQGE